MSDQETSLILGSSQLALQIHESCGHPTELDRVYGTEAAFAGRSFLTTDKRNNFRYGSDIVNLTADSVRPTGLGTFGWDDEGVPASTAPLVKNGEFVGYLDVARDGIETRPQEQRLHARRELESTSSHPHDQRLARTGHVGIG